MGLHPTPSPPGAGRGLAFAGASSPDCECGMVLVENRGEVDETGLGYMLSTHDVLGGGEQQQQLLLRGRSGSDSLATVAFGCKGNGLITGAACVRTCAHACVWLFASVLRASQRVHCGCGGCCVRWR